MERDHGYFLPKRRLRSGQNSRTILDPAPAPMLIPKLLAPAPGVATLRGSQAREMKAAPAALPIREYANPRPPLSWRVRKVLETEYFIRFQTLFSPERR